MIIINLIINGKQLTTNEVYIENVNNILVSNYHTLYYFINSFIDTQNYSIFLGNRKIDSKTSYIINLLDYESIANQLSMKKGTILYDYIYDEIETKVEETSINEDIEVILDKILNEVINEKTIDYDFSFKIDINKIINSYLNIKIDLSLSNYLSIIKKLIINLRQKNIRRTFIILCNNRIFKDQLDDIENVFIFNFYSNKFPNLLFTETIENIDKNILINHLKLNWPIEIKTEEIEKYISSFNNDLLISNDIIITDDYMKYIAYSILTKVLNIKAKIKLTLSIHDIPIIYKNYIKTL